MESLVVEDCRGHLSAQARVVRVPVLVDGSRKQLWKPDDQFTKAQELGHR